MKNKIKIEGIIETNFNHKDFIEEFIKWAEVMDSRFWGITVPVDDKGYAIEVRSKEE